MSLKLNSPLWRQNKILVAPDFFDKEVTDSNNIAPRLIVGKKYYDIQGELATFVQTPHLYEHDKVMDKVILAKKRIDTNLKDEHIKFLKNLRVLN